MPKAPTNVNELIARAQAQNSYNDEVLAMVAACRERLSHIEAAAQQRKEKGTIASKQEQAFVETFYFFVADQIRKTHPPHELH